MRSEFWLSEGETKIRDRSERCDKRAIKTVTGKLDGAWKRHNDTVTLQGRRDEGSIGMEREFIVKKQKKGLFRKI